MRLRPGDVEFGEVERGGVQAQQAGLPTLPGQQHLGLGRQRQLGVAGGVGLAAGEAATVVVEDFQFDAAERLAALQRLGEDVEAVAVAVRGQADVAQGEQRRRLRIGVGAGFAHHRQVHARLLQRFQAADRQQQGLAGVARRVEVEAPAVDQLGHRQQVARLPGVQAAAAAPAAEEGRQRLRLDAEELDVDLVDVQGDHRQPLGQAGRQQRAAAGEADGGLQVAGGEAGDMLLGQRRAGHRAQPGIGGEHQLAARFEVAQAHLHQAVGEFPGAVDLAVLAVDQVQPVGEFLFRIERHREAHRQRAGTVDLHFRDVHHFQRAAGVALHQGLGVGRGALLLLGSGRGGFRGFGGGRIAGAQQGKREGQKQSLVRHDRLPEWGLRRLATIAEAHAGRR
ncbi:hypothetical protein FQZ97_571960 [compost metagenome]